MEIQNLEHPPDTPQFYCGVIDGWGLYDAKSKNQKRVKIRKKDSSQSQANSGKNRTLKRQ